MSSKEVYCICRSSDASRFMICCDNCEEWYHGDCIKVSENESKYIKKYFCKKCRTRNPTLEIVYKSKYKELVDDIKKDKHSSDKHSSDKHSSDKHSSDKHSSDKHSSDKHREREKDKEKRKEKEKEKETDEERARRKEREREKERVRKQEKEREEKHKHRSEHKDKHHDKEKERKKEKERRRSRSRSGDRKDKKERDRHGHQSSETKPSKEPPAKIKREPKLSSSSSSSASSSSSSSSDDDGPVNRKQKKPTETVSGIKRERSESTDHRKPVIKDEPEMKKPKLEAFVKKEEPPSDDDDVDLEDDDDWKPEISAPPSANSHPVQKKSGKDKVTSKKASKAATSTSATASSKRQKKRRGRPHDDDTTSDDDIVVNDVGRAEEPKQCYGLKCKNMARSGSKYCSENCGINLATLRILQTLPDRIRQWNLTPCEADIRNRKELEKIRSKQDEVKTRLEQLSNEFNQLEELISRGKSIPVQDDDHDDDVDEASVHCVTCGADVHSKTAIRHMERCYNKMESKTSFASKYKTQIDDARMFCDFYNPKEDTYCKRLQVLCPEHNPDPRFLDDEVCGCPVSGPKSTNHQTCRLTRRQCQAHFGWEKLRRAELDMERVKQWMKVDELIEQERQVKSAMSSRAGVMALMLHSTFNHDVEDRLKEVRAQQMQPPPPPQQHHRKSTNHSVKK